MEGKEAGISASALGLPPVAVKSDLPCLLASPPWLALIHVSLGQVLTSKWVIRGSFVPSVGARAFTICCVRNEPILTGHPRRRLVAYFDG